MPYGVGQRLGDSIQAGLGAMDFSGYERAGATIGKTLSNLGKDINEGVTQYKNTELEIKKAEQVAKSIREAIPDLAPMAENALAELNNPNASQSERYAIAQAIGESLKIGVLGIENKRAEALLNLNKDELEFKKEIERGNLDLMAEKIRAVQYKPSKKKRDIIQTPQGGFQVQFDEYGQMYDLDGNPISTETLQNQYNETISPPDGVIPSGLPIGGDEQAGMTDKQISDMINATPQAGEVVDYGGIKEAMALGEGVLPEKGWENKPQKPFRLGFTPKEEKERTLQKMTLPDGSVAMGTMQGGRFNPVLGEDGKPIITKPTVTPDMQAKLDLKTQEEIKKSERMVETASELEKFLNDFSSHKGFTELYSLGVPTWVPFSRSAGAEAILEQIKASAFLQNAEKMRGLGQLTQPEGERLIAAATKLGNYNIRDAEALAEVQRMVSDISTLKANETAKIKALKEAKGGGSVPNMPEKLSGREANSTRLKQLTTKPE